MHNLCKILHCLSSNPEQRPYLNLHASACCLQNCINCCTSKEQNTSKVKLAVRNNYDHTHISDRLHLCTIFWRRDFFLIVLFSPSMPYTNFDLDHTCLWPCLFCDHFLSVVQKSFLWHRETHSDPDNRTISPDIFVLFLCNKLQAACCKHSAISICSLARSFQPPVSYHVYLTTEQQNRNGMLKRKWIT